MEFGEMTDWAYRLAEFDDLAEAILSRDFGENLPKPRPIRRNIFPWLAHSTMAEVMATEGNPMPPKTKAGKQAKVKTVLHEFKAGTLRSSAGPKVTNRKQAIAIALSESGQSKPKRKK
jgi:hypothetical protein